MEPSFRRTPESTVVAEAMGPGVRRDDARLGGDLNFYRFFSVPQTTPLAIRSSLTAATKVTFASTAEPSRKPCGGWHRNCREWACLRRW